LFLKLFAGNVIMSSVKSFGLINLDPISFEFAGGSEESLYLVFGN